MTGHLLFVILMISSHEYQVQALPSPTLTVSTAVISETDSVTLHCQAPASASVHHCYFYTGEQQSIRGDSCLQTLTGTELLLMSHQRSPAEVKVRCFYTVEDGSVNSPSAHSHPSSISIQTLLPPTLTVSTAVISETDSVTLHCQAPASASVYHCYFYTGEQQSNKDLSCLQTLTATKMLLISHQRSPAEVKVRCLYTVNYGSVTSTSPHSNPSSITIQSQKPEMSVQHFDGEFVLIMCSLPGSVKDDTRCNLYFGEASRPFLNEAVSKESSRKTKQRSCRFYVAVADFLSHLHYVQQKDASCDYTLESGPYSLSPRSDRYNMTDIMKKESPTTKVYSPCTMTTALSLSNPSASNNTTPVTPPSEVPKLQNPTSQKKKKTSAASRATTTKSTSTTTTAKPQQDSSPSTTVNSPSKSAESSLTTASASTSTSTVDSPSEEVSRKINTKSSFTLTTAESSLSSFSASTSTTSVISPSGTGTLTVVLVVVGSGVTVGAILLVLALFRSKRRTEGYSLKRTRTNIQDDFVCMTNIDTGRMLTEGDDGAYSVITSIPGASCATGAEKLNKQERKEQDSDIYHPYATISEKPAAPVSQDMTYIMLQAH
ncbi:serine-rich adhesin for platelets [Oreochromis niloticus]|uniref:serine-rich adhesin for platelets n=1 Tax=Oreochromis niloticus TaxID=8128 RepID=UPI0009058FE4|nr:serine-rich adhesin for platelets [Oreochromis niloticus]